MFYIYLDTSFLSELTKAARDTPQASSKIGKWRNLLTLLRQEVNRGALLCPASQFQTEEAMLAERILPAFVSLQLELSKGYYFKEYQDIVSGYWIHHYYSHRTRCQNSTGDAFLWEYSQRKRGNRPIGQLRQERLDRYGDHSSRSGRWSQHSSRVFSKT